MQYTLIRSKNRRRSLSMRFIASGELVVRAPILMPKFFIDRFVANQSRWIARQQRARAKPVPVLQKYFPSTSDLEHFIRETVSKYELSTGLRSAGLRFTHVKSYWGSCAPTGVIAFNLHLQYAPREAVEYVVVHELCHLKYRGHGKRFWDLVAAHFPRTPEMRRVLRTISRGQGETG